MEETIIEIPENVPEEGWQPPVVTTKETEKKPKIQRYSDVFFIQYVICILLMTVFIIIRLFDHGLGDRTAQSFLTSSHAPTEEVVSELITFLQSRWK